jgi:glycosyltransferase 2 family protein
LGRQAGSKRAVGSLLGWGIALGCLVWVFHDLDVHAFLRDIAGISWTLVGFAVAADIGSYVCQAARWVLLLRPLGRLSLLRATQAIYIGLFTNEILPLRAGEIVRTLLVARWLPARPARVLASIAVERLFDGIWLAAAIGLAALFVPLPRRVLEAEEILAAALVVALGVVAWVVVSPGTRGAVGGPGSPPRHPIARAWGQLRPLAASVREIGRSRQALAAFGISSLALAFQVLAFWLVMRACGLPLSLGAGAIVLLIVHAGTALPNAPSNLGTYQLFTVVGLAIFGVEKQAASAFSVVVFVILTVPLWALGVVALGQTGANLAGLREQVAAFRAGGAPAFPAAATRREGFDADRASVGAAPGQPGDGGEGD